MQRARSLFCQRRSLFESGIRILDSGIRLGLRSSNLSRGVGAFLYCGGIYPGLCALTTLSAAAAADPSASVAFAFLALAAFPPDGSDGPDAPDGPDKPGMQFGLRALVLISAVNLLVQCCHTKVRLLTCTECFGDARARIIFGDKNRKRFR